MASKAISELAPLAQTLNKESNEINSTIAAINKQLAALNLGLSVWCKAPDGDDYGFTMVDDSWQLATRWDGREVDPTRNEYVDVSFHEALLKCTRDERIIGLELVPQIIEKMKEAAAHKIAIIREAKKFAAGVDNA